MDALDKNIISILSQEIFSYDKRIWLFLCKHFTDDEVNFYAENDYEMDENGCTPNLTHKELVGVQLTTCKLTSVWNNVTTTMHCVVERNEESLKEDFFRKEFFETKDGFLEDGLVDYIYYDNKVYYIVSDISNENEVIFELKYLEHLTFNDLNQKAIKMFDL